MPHLIGIDLGGTKILGVRADERGNIAQELRVETRGEDGQDAVIDQIAQMVRDLR
jgi:predicted NBD/HSP70 family sugar kinase